MQTRNAAFENHPLITPEWLANDPVAALAIAPSWVRFHAITRPEELDAAPVVSIVMGGKSILAISLTLAETGALFEVSRCGHRGVTNSNHSKPVPTVHPRMMFRDAPEDMMSFTRILHGAVDHEVIKQGRIKSDLRGENLHTIPGGKPDKDARKTTMRHVARLAREREAGGTLPKGFDISAYLANIERLFAIVDREAGGEDPISALPLVPSETSTWPFGEMSTEETLGRLTSAAFTIAFALKLPEHETASFLRDWQDHKPLKPWLDRRMVTRA
ncbi:hypothetical protein LGH82_21075 [Mesorhizobium sp. PAMC28654]|uniref:hypothetical protein n=1 Tax=Mesorhizobium sp. PAMC28654 TaxID=2880934 RepID=UPI001D0A3F97|nr:hypothetical protein [Mesorhizobium sp. PAMC28654]UDL87657.1 hypothetical protein LGH82_21075 [Mesorhizobium sp. PAMC28654]